MTGHRFSDNINISATAVMIVKSRQPVKIKIAYVGRQYLVRKISEVVYKIEQFTKRSTNGYSF